jgi:hypothetical protein
LPEPVGDRHDLEATLGLRQRLHEVTT